VRGAGGILVDKDGRRFAFDADPRGELAPRDVVARAVAAADATGGAWLDAREIDGFAARFPGVTEILQRHGLNPGKDLIPVAPALHYAMGGIRTDLDGRSTRPGLWAVGEVACTGVHGANRLASNSLLEGMVFADRVARALLAGPRTSEAAQAGKTWMEGVRPHVVPHRPAEVLTAALGVARTPRLPLPAFPPSDGDALAGRAADDAAAPTVAEMRRIMTNDVSLVRTETGLRRARRALTRLAHQLPPEAWRAHHQLLVARLITRAALRRRESRGGHRRLDYPPTPSPSAPVVRAPSGTPIP
jgi:L-aspartate oxidase